MKIFISTSVRKKYKIYLRKDSKISTKIDDTIAKFKQSPTYPSLRLHKLKNKQRELWSLSVSGDIRLIFEYVEDGILISDIGKHEEVY